MAGPKGGEIAGRLRAARGYAGLKQPEMAKALGISVETLSRMENGRTTVHDETKERVATICGVPGAFLQAGWPAAVVSAGDHDRFGALEQRMAGLEALVTQRLGRELRDSIQEVLQGMESRPSEGRQRSARRKSGS